MLPRQEFAMPASTPCPDVRSYQGLIAGQLPDAEKETLLQHLEECDACVAKVQTLPQQDILLSCIRQAKSPSISPEDKRLAPLIRRLIQLQPSPANSAAGSVLASRDTGSSRVLSFACTACGKPLCVKENLAGKKVKCPRCGQVITAPAVVREPEPAPTTTPEAIETVALPPTVANKPRDGGGPAPQAETPQQSSIKQDLCAFLAPPLAPDELGRLGPYRVLKVLGAGGMGVVFRAEDPQLQRLVALKAMLPALAENDSARQRFLREARAAASIKHDHIVTIHQVGEDRGAPFLAMEFLEGEALDERVKREGKLPLAEVLRIGGEIAAGLEAAHEHGLIHRDIKPGNVWLEGKRGRVKILDFGLARTITDDIHLTQSGAIVGTPAYMPPEQARGEKVDSRCDLYSLGCVLYRLCTGELPFKGDNAMSLLMALAIEQPKSPREVNPDVPPALADLIIRLLAKDPAQRPATAGEVAEALRDIGAGEPAPRKAAQVPAPPRRRRRLLAAAGAGGFVLAALLTVIVIRLGKPEEGTVTIETVDPNVELVFSSGGREYTVRDKKTGEEIKLPLGSYRVALNGGKEKLKLETNQFTLKRGDRPLVKVTWQGNEESAEARVNLPAPVQVSEPPPLVEWLKGRKILTVSQDGKGQFMTIQKALNALKPGQVVKVLDRGPYRESLRLEAAPQDTGLISEQNTLLELPKWESAAGHEFGAVDGFRLNGFRFLAPLRKQWSVLLRCGDSPSGLVIEDCCFDPQQFLDPWPCVHSIQLKFQGSHPIKEPIVVRRCAIYGGQLLISGNSTKAVVLVENNYFHKTATLYGGSSCLAKLVLRHNVFDYLGPHFRDLKGDATTLELSNNTITGPRTQFLEGVPTGGVTVCNNILCWGLSFNTQEGAAQHRQAAQSWRVGHNCYLDYEGKENPFPVLSKGATDLVDQADFVLNPAALDYLRLPSNSPLAKAGAGGAWPSYLGALPPGPAPKDGDWFTRLRQRWDNATPVAKPPSAPAEIPEPPPLAEWIKGRKVLTVAQDGSGQFKTIQAALDAVRPGQVVKVLDRGPYRESLRLLSPSEDIGLVSECQTVVEVADWKTLEGIGPDYVYGHSFVNVQAFRLSGFAFRFGEKSDKYCNGLCWSRPIGLVVEDCAFQHVETKEKSRSVGSMHFSWYGESIDEPTVIRDCLIHHQLSLWMFDASAPILIERNYIPAGGIGLLRSVHKAILRHNILDGSDGLIAVQDCEASPEALEISNNTISKSFFNQFHTVAPERGVTICNNLLKTGLLFYGGAEKQIPVATRNWNIIGNCYTHYLGESNMLSARPGDLSKPANYISTDSTDRNYLHISAESPQSTGGAGGAWPRYVGALPPGPAPKDGDWFTRVREKWLKDKPAAGK
jgi:hypothetical protein